MGPTPTTYGASPDCGPDTSTNGTTSAVTEWVVVGATVDLAPDPVHTEGVDEGLVRNANTISTVRLL